MSWVFRSFWKALLLIINHGFLWCRGKPDASGTSGIEFRIFYHGPKIHSYLFRARDDGMLFWDNSNILFSSHFSHKLPAGSCGTAEFSPDLNWQRVTWDLNLTQCVFFEGVAPFLGRWIIVIKQLETEIVKLLGLARVISIFWHVGIGAAINRNDEWKIRFNQYDSHKVREVPLDMTWPNLAIMAKTLGPHYKNRDEIELVEVTLYLKKSIVNI